MSRVLLVLLLAALLSATPSTFDPCRSGVIAWEAADDSAAALILEDGGGPTPRAILAAPAVAIETAPASEPTAPHPQSLPAALGRAPPAR
ncbi:MAG: hypothetical protein HYR51_06645 [Candidatus Rokubacteria bacterium]|nr:hypothetical protein [Candidatus Rokubacteria bacterium]